MSRFDGLVAEAVKRGFKLVDKCAKEVDEYNLENVTVQEFSKIVSAVLPKRVTMQWALDMIAEQPAIYTYPIDNLPYEVKDLKQLVPAVLDELVYRKAIEQVEPYARKAGFISEADPNYETWARRRGHF